MNLKFLDDHEFPYGVKGFDYVTASRERPKSALYLRFKIVKRGDPFGFVKLQLVGQNFKKIEGETLWWNPKSFKKSRIVSKKIRVKSTKGGVLCYRGSGRRYFCFGRGSGGSSMFWRSVVKVDDVEQMNKKVDRSR